MAVRTRTEQHQRHFPHCPATVLARVIPRKALIAFMETARASESAGLLQVIAGGPHYSHTPENLSDAVPRLPPGAGAKGSTYLKGRPFTLPARRAACTRWVTDYPTDTWPGRMHMKGVTQPTLGHYPHSMGP